MSNKYKIGNVSFGCREDKDIYILKGVIHSLQYIGKETHISINKANQLRNQGKLSIDIDIINHPQKNHYYMIYHDNRSEISLRPMYIN